MRLKYLEIAEYKKFKNVKINFFDTDSENKQYINFYGNLEFSVLVGENGVGKTTILSFLTEIFHHLQRFQDRITSEFVLIYEIFDFGKNKYIHVKLQKEGKNIFITIEDIIEKSLILEWNIKKRDYSLKNHQMKIKNVIKFESIRNYMPSSIVTSVFSVKDEYFYTWQDNFIGEKIIKSYNISDVYNTSIFKLSKVIARFIKTYSEHKEKFNNLLGIFNFNFIWQVEVKFRCNQYFFSDSESNGYEMWGKFLYEIGYKKWISFLKSLDKDIYQYFCNYIKDNGQYRKLVYFDMEKLEEVREKLSDIEEYNLQDEIYELEEFWIHFMEKLSTIKTIDIRKKSIRQIIMQLEEYGLIYLNDIYFRKNKFNITFNKMSSGEKMFLTRVLSILSSIKDNSLIIIEEPELHLNPSWIKQVITVLECLFSEFKVHFLVATHSYLFINSLLPRNILVIDNKGIRHPDFNTLLANETEINSKLFKNSSNYNFTEKKLIQKIDISEEEELEELISCLGESYVKFYAFSRLMKLKEDKNVESN